MIKNISYVATAVICMVGCSAVNNVTKEHLSELEIESNVQNFSLESEGIEYEMPEHYLSRFDGKFSDIGDLTPVKDKAPLIDENYEPGIDFIEQSDLEESMAMFGDTDEEKRIFYVKTAAATVYRQMDASRKPIKVLKMGQRIKASLENGWAKIGDHFYMSLEDLSLTPATTVRAASRD